MTSPQNAEVGACPASRAPMAVTPTDAAVYLDHAATTPMRPEAIAAMMRARLVRQPVLAAPGRRARGSWRNPGADRRGVRRPAQRGRSPPAHRGRQPGHRPVWPAARRPQRRTVLIAAAEHHAVLDRRLAGPRGRRSAAAGRRRGGLPRRAARRDRAGPGHDRADQRDWANKGRHGAALAELAEVARGTDPFHSDVVQAAGHAGHLAGSGPPR